MSRNNKVGMTGGIVNLSVAPNLLPETRVKELQDEYDHGRWADTPDAEAAIGDLLAGIGAWRIHAIGSHQHAENLVQSNFLLKKKLDDAVRMKSEVERAAEDVRRRAHEEVRSLKERVKELGG